MNRDKDSKLLAISVARGVALSAAAAGSASGGRDERHAGRSGTCSHERGGRAPRLELRGRAGTGRAVAMSLIGLAFAVVAGVALAFRRDFKAEAAVFAVGIVAAPLATPTGLSLLRETVTSLFGA